MCDFCWESGNILVSTPTGNHMCYIWIFLLQGISFEDLKGNRGEVSLYHSPLGTIKEQGTIVSQVTTTIIFIDNMLRIIGLLYFIYREIIKS